jgi:hypothetical protein
VGPEAATQTDISRSGEQGLHAVLLVKRPAGDERPRADEEANGDVYVRCLTGKAPIGTPKPSYLAVGTGRISSGARRTPST